MKKFILIVAFCFPLLSMAQLKLLTPQDKIKSGQPIQLQYVTKAKNAEVRLSFARFKQGQRMVFDEIKTVNANGKTIGTYILPDSIKAFAILVEIDDSTDTNKGKGYVFSKSDMVGGKDVSPLDKAVFYDTKERAAKKYLGINEDKSRSLDVYRKYFKLNPALKDEYAEGYLTALNTFEPQSAEFLPLFNKTFNRLKGISNAEWRAVTLMDLFLGNNKKIYDSLYKVVVQAYPEGYNAAWTYIAKLNRSNNIDSIENLFPDIRNKFSKADFFVYPLNYYYTNLIIKIGSKYANDYNKIIDYYRCMTDYQGQTLYLMNLADEMLKYKASKNAADSVAKLAILISDSIIKSPTYKPEGITKQSWVKYYERSYLANYYASYAGILYGQGKYEEALIKQKKYNELSNNNFTDAGVNANYLKILNGNNQYEESLQLGRRFIDANTGSSDLVNAMAIAYKKLHTDVDTSFYISKLNKEVKDVKYKKVKELMVNTPSVDFTLKDLDGQTISLDSLKGKIVVIDFWATWCGPCKKSFPGMQRAIYKYLRDKDVVFLFIDTWEENDNAAVRTKEIKDFMTKNQYSFKVLLDEKIGDKYKTVTDYKVEGIPTKFVIDATGKVRFKTLGVHNTDEEVAEEISAMIDMLKEDVTI